jgi:hypothetical protein
MILPNKALRDVQAMTKEYLVVCFRLKKFAGSPRMKALLETDKEDWIFRVSQWLEAHKFGINPLAEHLIHLHLDLNQAKKIKPINENYVRRRQFLIKGAKDILAEWLEDKNRSTADLEDMHTQFFVKYLLNNTNEAMRVYKSIFKKIARVLETRVDTRRTASHVPK